MLAVLAGTTTSKSSKGAMADPSFRNRPEHGLRIAGNDAGFHGDGFQGGGRILQAVAGQYGHHPGAGGKPSLLPHFDHAGKGRGGSGFGKDPLCLGQDRKSTRLNSSHVKISYA